MIKRAAAARPVIFAQHLDRNTPRTCSMTALAGRPCARPAAADRHGLRPALVDGRQSLELAGGDVSALTNRISFRPAREKQDQISTCRARRYEMINERGAGAVPGPDPDGEPHFPTTAAGRRLGPAPAGRHPRRRHEALGGSTPQQRARARPPDDLATSTKPPTVWASVRLWLSWRCRNHDQVPDLVPCWKAAVPHLPLVDEPKALDR